MRKTKIIATLGPATSTEEAISAIILAGVNAVRINCSHGTLEEHEEKLTIVRKVASELGRYVAILQDLPGPKIRVGKLSPLTLVKDELVNLVPGESDIKDAIPVQYRQIVQDVQEGGKILIDDGNIELAIIEKSEDRLLCKVIEAGTVTSNKGINLPGANISAPSLGDHDRKLLKWGIEHEVDYVALSFVRSPAEIWEAKEIISESGGFQKIIAKIEKPEALEQIEDIIQDADGIMVARGDLGVEMSPETVPETQKQLIRLCNEKDKTVITATQMLESMTRSTHPTRAEASDVANAIIDGTDCVMLSGETAIGKYPVQTVKMMDRIAIEAEKYSSIHCSEKLHTTLSQLSPIGDAVCHGAYQIVNDIDIDLIGIFTITGNTALLMSKYRSSKPIAGLSPDDKSLRRMALYYGVYPVHIETGKYFEEMVEQAEKTVKKLGLAGDGKTVLFTAGLPIGTTGTTNSLQIRKLGS